MRRLLVTAALSLLWPAAAAPAAEAAHDSVTGTARHLGADPPFPVIQVHINALGGTSGAPPRGHVDATIKTLGVRERGRVICLNVFGNRATVGTEIVESTDPAHEGQGQLWSVVDNGESDHLDRIAGFPIAPTPPTTCPPLFFSVPIVTGNYVIHPHG